MASSIQLKSFTAKTTPVLADIIYAADSANSFDEVQITIAELINVYPALTSIGALTTAANEFIYTTASNTYATAPITAFGIAVLALAAGVTTPTAGALATWDANKNLSANSFIPGYTTTVTSATPIVLTVASAYYQFLTGSTAQTITMPVTSTLATIASGTTQSYEVVNNSSASATINSSGGNLIETLPAGSRATFTCILNTGTTAASWASDSVLNRGNVAPTIQKFTSGSGTYTAPTSPSPLYIRVVMVGGGAGGDGSGTSPGAAGSGGNTTFGTTLLAANGGTAGSQGAGGTASLGSGPIGIALSGAQGGTTVIGLVNSDGVEGAGSFFGGRGTSGSTGFGGGNASANTGSGGGGAGGGASFNGAAGGAAGGYVDAIITSISATYSYAVGSGGAGGTLGSGGSAGGSGGAGLLVVYEYYQ
jgi:hypothetical protein